MLVVFAAAGERQLASVKGLSLGIMSAAQGRYSPAQLLLDITQGVRIASSAYPRTRPPALSVMPAGAGATVTGWAAARRRAEAAPALLAPGLLAAQLPGGAGYAGVAGQPHLDAVLAAGRDGRIARFSTGPAPTLLARVAALRASLSLVVVDLARGAQGGAELGALARARAGGELLLVLERAPAARGAALLWSGAAGLGGGGARELSSQSTEEPGLIASIDLAPTILQHLGRTVPAPMRGKPIRAEGRLRPARLGALMARLQAIDSRRLPALGLLLLAWALLLAASARWPRARARALRIGGLGLLWAPVALLVPAALEPPAAVEYVMIVALCGALGALSDLLAPWPRAPLMPALAAFLAIVIDALARTQLLMRSLLGPDPVLGARFYGVGNELKSGLAVLALAGLAAALYPAARSVRAAAAIAATGVALALIEGSARIGAGVGGVILVCAGFALAATLMLPDAGPRRRALAVIGAPVAGLAALAALDLATARGGGHFTGSILHARSAQDVRDLVVRRYEAAWGELRNHAMPAAAALALVCACAGVALRERVLAPVRGDPAWSAALAGGLAAGAIGALTEDSGPLLLVVAVFALACVSSYLWGRPPASKRTDDRIRAARSRAPTPPVAPAR